MRRLLPTLFLLITSHLCALAAEPPLANADVLKLVQAKLSAPVIVQAIETAPAVAFSLTPDDLITLKRNGVPDAVISAMLERTTQALASASPPATASERSVTVRIVPGGRDWPLWSRYADETAAVGVLFLPDAPLQNNQDALAALAAYNTTPQGILVVGGGQDTFSFYSYDCYRLRAENCPRSERVQFVGAQWAPPSEVKVPLSTSTTSIAAIAVIRYSDGKLRMITEDEWRADRREENRARCTTRSWAVGNVGAGGMTLSVSMDIDYKRWVGSVYAVRLCPQLTFN